MELKVYFFPGAIYARGNIEYKIDRIEYGIEIINHTDL